MSDDRYEAVLRDLSRYFDTERTGVVPYQRQDYSLEPLRRYLDGHGALQPAPHVLHVGGTKGKGSVTTLLAALAHAHGLSTGSYLSPHLVSYRERIRFDGRAVDRETFAEAVRQVLEEKPDPGGSPMRSVFELLTAAAAILYRRRGVEVAVFEVGLGGRLDATNVLHTTTSVLTPVSLDHTEVLGTTIPAIAADKADILRAGRPAVIGPQTPEALQVILERAAQRGARPIVYGRDYRAETTQAGFSVVFADGLRLDGLRPAMPGSHQARNAAVALAAYRAALGDPQPELARRVVATTRLEGRLQAVPIEGGGTVVLDGAHNPFAAANLADEAAALYGKPLALLLAVASNKDIAGILTPLLPLGDPVLLSTFGGPRAAAPETLAESARTLGCDRALSFSELGAAWQHWLQIRSQRPVLLATGSLFLVGALLRLLHQEGRIELDPEPDPVF
jgi:dihydrofolate synthase/folylpolyglutamate synthase